MYYGNIDLFNVRDIVSYNDGCALFNRLPSEIQEETDEVLKKYTSYETAGCEIRFRINSGVAKLIIENYGDPHSQGYEVAQLYFGDFESNYPVFLKVGKNEIEVKYPENLDKLLQLFKRCGGRFNPEMVRLVLPIKGLIRVISVEGDVCLPKTGDFPNKKLMMYGSSITNGEGSNLPTRTYAYKTAEELGIELINLGFAGTARLEPKVADFLAAKGQQGGFDVLTLELGINMSEEKDYDLFCTRAKYFVETIAKANPKKPIFVIDIFSFSGDYENGEHIKEMRRFIRDLVADLNMFNLRHIDGRKILPTVEGCTCDICHPSGGGMVWMAKNLAKYIKPYLQD